MRDIFLSKTKLIYKRRDKVSVKGMINCISMVSIHAIDFLDVAQISVAASLHQLELLFVPVVVSTTFAIIAIQVLELVATG